MPSTKNPGSLAPGAGIVPPKTVPSAGLITPDRDVAALKAHLTDPTRAHMASAIGIVDAGGYYTATDVEGALQALPGGIAAGRQNGFVTGGTFSTLGRTVTLDPGSSVLLRGVLKSVGGESVTCPILAGTYYVYFDGSTGSLSVGTGLPDLDDEPVWVTEVTHDGTNVTGSRDARFFVTNLDRKLDYTAREDSGTAANNEAEACFVTLEAAFFWLEKYGGAQDVKRTLIVRGSHTVASTLTLPWDNLEIRGEGEAEITFTGSSVLFQGTLATGLKITGITFVCNTGGNPVAIGNTSASSGFEISRCRFLSGTGQWYNAVQLLTDNSRHVIRDCYIEAQNTTAGCVGVYIYGPTECTLENLTVVGPGAANPYTIGLFLGCNPAVHAESKNRVAGCRVSDFDEGIDFWNIGTGTSVTDCDISGVVKGAGISSDCDDTVFTECRIRPDTTDGLIGITTAAARTKIQGCDISTARDVTSYGADEPFGVQFTGTASDGVVTDTTIRGFVSTTATDSAGVFFDGQSGTPTGLVDGCIFENCGVYVYRTEGVTVSNNRVTIPNAFGAIQQRAVFSLEEVSDIALLGNVVDAGGVDGFAYGVLCADPCSRISISENQFQNIFAGIFVGSDFTDCIIDGNTFANIVKPLAEPSDGAAVYLDGALARVRVANNLIDGYSPVNTEWTIADGIVLKGSASDLLIDVSVIGNTVTRCRSGILVRGNASNFATQVQIKANDISYCTYADTPYNALTFADSGAKGIGVDYASHISIQDNAVSNIGLMRFDDGSVATLGPSDVSSNGVFTYNTYPVTIAGNTISGLNATTGGESHGIHAVYVTTGVVGMGGVVVNDNDLNLLQDELESGTATSGSALNLEDTTKTWTVNEFVGAAVHLTGGTGAGQVRYVLLNTSDTLTMTSAWGTNPDATTTYAILRSEVNGTAGIRISVRNPVGVAGLVGVTIEDNAVTTHAATSGYVPYTNGVLIDADNSITGTSIQSVHLRGNTVQGWGSGSTGAALRILGDAAGVLNLTGVVVTDNVMLATNTGVSNFGLHINAALGSVIVNLSTSENTVLGQTDSLVPTYAMYLDLDGAISSVTIDGNTLSGQYGVFLQQGSGTADWSTLSVSGNTIRGERSIIASTGGVLADILICNNRIGGLGTAVGVTQGLDVTCDTFDDMHVDGNVVPLAATAFSKGIEITASSKSTRSTNLSVSRNSVRMADTGATNTIGVEALIGSRAQGVCISENRVDLGASGSTANVGIKLHTDATADSVWQNFVISNNTVQGDFPVGANYALLLNTTAGSFTNVPENWTVSGNCGMGAGTGSGFSLQNSGTFPGNAINISGNTFTGFTAAACATRTALPTNSVCVGNISQAGGGAGFTTFGFAINANNQDY